MITRKKISLLILKALFVTALILSFNISNVDATESDFVINLQQEVSVSPLSFGDYELERLDFGGVGLKVMSNSQAKAFAQRGGFRDAHELKETIVGKANISKYDLYSVNKSSVGYLLRKTDLNSGYTLDW